MANTQELASEFTSEPKQIKSEVNGESKTIEYKEVLRNVVDRSCKEETAEPVEGILQGKIPKWLRGIFLRNGPGKREIGEDQYNHWFDGLALLHCFNIEDGNATYRSKFIKTEAYKKNVKANRIVVSEFGTTAHPDPCATMFDRLRTAFYPEPSDNTNVNVFKIGDSYYAATELNSIRKIDPETVETKEQVLLSDYIAVNHATAHPHWEKDGTLYNIGNSYNLRPTYNFIKFPPSQKKGDNSSFEKAEIVCRIPSSRAIYPSYYHSFGMSENYLIFLEQSMILNLPQLIWSKIRGTDLKEILFWEPNQQARFWVVEKSTGKILPQKFMCDPLMTFHHANAYEEDGHLVVDLAGYKNGDMLYGLFLDEMKKKTESRTNAFYNTETRRYVLPISDAPGKLEMNTNLVKIKGTEATAKKQSDGSIFCQYENLSPGLSSFELIQINYDFYNGKKYEYLYGVARREGKQGESILGKINVQDKTQVLWSEKGKFPSEPYFVANPDGVAEDDGVILSSLIHEKDENKMTLLVLDAKNMKELARVNFEAKSAVTASFHGPFVKK